MTPAVTAMGMVMIAIAAIPAAATAAIRENAFVIARAAIAISGANASGIMARNIAGLRGAANRAIRPANG